MDNPDFSKMSDDDLRAIASGGSQPQQVNPQSNLSDVPDDYLKNIVASGDKNNPYTKMSDEDLMSVAYGGAAKSGPDDTQQSSGLDAVTRGIKNGFFFNYGRNVTAAAAASPFATDLEKSGQVSNVGVIDAALGAGRIGLEKIAPGTFGHEASDIYKNIYQGETEKNKAAEEAHPYLYGAGELGGAAVNPASWIAPEANPAASTAVKLAAHAAPGAIQGAVGGYGSGDTTDESIRNMLVGGLTGGVLGGALGSLGTEASKAVTPGAAGATPDIIAAANKLGVDVPTYLAGSDPLRYAGTLLSSVPIAGAPIEKAGQEFTSQLSSKIDNIGNVDPKVAGQSISDGLRDWIGPQSKAIIDKAYDDMGNFVDKDAFAPLNNTNKAVEQINFDRTQAALKTSPAVKMVNAALQRPEGLNYDGMKSLRSAVGEIINTPSLLPQGSKIAEYKQLYSALSKDMENNVITNGGATGAGVAKTVSNMYKQMQDRNQALSSILGGPSGGASSEGVFANAISKAKTGRSADTDLLQQAKSVLTPEQWQDFQGGVIGTLGRNPDGSFNPGKFLGPSGYNSLSKNGKDILFGPTGSAHRDALDAIYTLSKPASTIPAAKALSAKAGPIEGAGLAAAAWSNPYMTIAGLAGGRTIASMLARPATANAMKNYSFVYRAYKSAPSQATLSALNAMAGQMRKTYAYGTANVIPGLNQVGPAIQSMQGGQGHADGNRIGRATGGKVIDAQTLVRNAERAKKRINEGTEPLLTVPDEAITKALAIANEKI